MLIFQMKLVQESEKLSSSRLVLHFQRQHIRLDKSSHRHGFINSKPYYNMHNSSKSAPSI